MVTTGPCLANRGKVFLGQQRDGIKFMHDQTLRMMNFGYVPSEIANQIEFPLAWHDCGI